MTDSQAINSSVLADWLQCATQMSNSFKAYRNSLPEGCTQRALASDLWARMDGASVNLDALRALVAEQEQEDIPNYDNHQLCPKCRGCGETAPWDSECSFQCEVCKGEGMVPIEQEQASAVDSPQFAVGDTVMITGTSLWNRGVGENATITGVKLNPEPYDSAVPYAQVETESGDNWGVALTDLTLIAKGQA